MVSAERLRYETYRARVQATLYALIDANKCIHEALADLGQLDSAFAGVARQQQWTLLAQIEFWRVELESIEFLLDDPTEQW